MSTPTRQELTITITARFDGFATEVCFTGQLDQMPSITKRIRELGGEPTAPHSAPLGGEKKSTKKVQPAYDGNGDPICPTHRKPLAEGRYGLYCPAKAKPGEEQNDKGYCSLKFTDE